MIKGTICITASKKAFNKAGSRSFGNYFTRSVGLFDVDNSSPSRTDNIKNDLLVLSEETTDSINGSVNTAEKKFNFTKAKTKF